jgi:hypothetical protein
MMKKKELGESQSELRIMNVERISGMDWYETKGNMDELHDRKQYGIHLCVLEEGTTSTTTTN